MAKKAAAKKTAFGRDLIDGMKQVLAHQRGKIELEQVWPRPVDVKAIRRQVNMSQAEFARKFGLRLRSLQEWEQARRLPDLAVMTYLRVIERNPGAVEAALRSTTA